MIMKRLLLFLRNIPVSVLRAILSYQSVMRLVGFRHLLGSWKRSLLAVSGIALGVMIFVAITLSNEMILHSVYRMNKQLMSGADFVITAPTGGMAENIVDRVKKADGVAHVAPLLERTLFLPEYNTYMLMVGADFLGDTYFFEEQKPEDISSIGDPLFLIGTTDSLLLPKPFAENYQIKQGDIIKVPTPDGQSDFTVLGLVDPKGIAQAFGGHLLMLDLGAAQIRMQAMGKVDRILVAVDPGADPVVVQTQIQKLLGPDLTVGLPGDMAKQSMKTLSGFAVSMQMLSMLALLLGIFLVYNTMTISMISRRRETAILRLLGISRKSLLSVVIGEATVLGIWGSVFGILGGWMLAGGAMDLIIKNISTAYVPVILDTQNYYSLLFTAATLGYIMGVGTAVMGSVVPAWQASKVSPLQAMHGSSNERLLSPHNSRRIFFSLVPLSAISVIHIMPESQGNLGFSTLSVFLLLVIILILTPGFMTVLLKLLANPMQKIFGILGRIAVDNINNGLERSWINVTSLSIGVCMIVSIVCFIHTTKTSVLQWLEQTLSADFLVTGDANLGTESRRPMNDEIMNRFSAIPGVAHVYGYRRLTSANTGQSVDILGMDDIGDRGDNLSKVVLKGSLPSPQEMKGKPCAIINEILARKQQILPGSTLFLQTPGGRKAFQVKAVITDFMGDRSTAYVHREWVRNLWQDHLVDGIYFFLKKGADPVEIQKQIYTYSGPQNRIFVYSAQDIRKQVTKALDQMFSLISAVEILALVVAILGIFNTIWTEIVDRAKEISMLRVIGMLPSQLRKCFILEALLMGFGAAVLGIISGLVNTYYLVRQMVPIIIGWSLPYKVNWPGVFLFCGLIFLVTVFTGYLASYQATRGRAI